MFIPVVAFYWNGGVPERHDVKGVSLGGAYITTQDRWYQGTIMTMTMQYDPYYLQVARIAGSPEAAVRMRGKIVRFGSDGVGIQFVYLNKQERTQFEQFLAGAQVQGEA